MQQDGIQMISAASDSTQQPAVSIVSSNQATDDDKVSERSSISSKQSDLLNQDAMAPEQSSFSYSKNIFKKRNTIESTQE